MKKSKLLFLLPAATIVATIPSVTSCGNQGWTAEDVAHAIIDPVNLPQATPPHDTLIECIEELNERDRQKELIYDLYSLYVNKVDAKLDISGKTFAELYKDNTVEIVTNITKCSLEVVEHQNAKWIESTFLGYISFVFIKDFNDSFKKNDYVMYTFDIDRIFTQIDGWGFRHLLYDHDVGIKKIRNNGHEYLDHIEAVWTIGEAFPPNSHNWKK